MANLAPGTVIGRYALFDALASGGMATVHVGRLMGPVGFARTVAIKRLHPQFSRDPEFVSMFLDEARMCARIRHPNVVPTLDVVADGGELFLVMEYIQGESLSHLVKGLQGRGERMPWRIALAIVVGALHGLHAAHESKDERGVALGLVHRDVSPQNILVGTDGMARVLDFGIAKAAGRTQTTREGAVKGKLGYMAPEQMAAESISRQADLYAAAVVLWELVAGRRLFDGDSETVILAKVLTAPVDPPSKYAPHPQAARRDRHEGHQPQGERPLRQRARVRPRAREARTRCARRGGGVARVGRGAGADRASAAALAHRDRHLDGRARPARSRRRHRRSALAVRAHDRAGALRRDRVVRRGSARDG